MADDRLWNGDADDNNIATAANYVGDAAPVSTDSAFFPAMTAVADDHVDGSDFSAVLLVDFIVEKGNYLTYGSRDAYLQLDCDYFEFRGAGAHAYFDIDNCAELRVLNAPTAASGQSYGLNLVGTSNTLLIVDVTSGGTMGVGALGGESMAITTVQVDSGDLTFGPSITTTTFHANNGTIEHFSDITTLNVSGGIFTQAKNKPTTLNLYGGRYFWSSAGTITKINLYGGVLDLSRGGLATLATDIDWYGGQIYDPGNILTTTNPISRKNGGTVTLS